MSGSKVIEHGKIIGGKYATSKSYIPRVLNKTHEKESSTATEVSVNASFDPEAKLQQKTLTLRSSVLSYNLISKKRESIKPEKAKWWAIRHKLDLGNGDLTKRSRFIHSSRASLRNCWFGWLYAWWSNHFNQWKIIIIVHVRGGNSDDKNSWKGVYNECGPA